MEELAALIEAVLGTESADLLTLCSDEELAEHEQAILDGYRAVRAGEVEGVAADDLEMLDVLEAARNEVLAERDRRVAAAEAAAAEAEETAAELARRDAEILGDASAESQPAEGDGDAGDGEGDEESEAEGDDAGDSGEGDSQAAGQAVTAATARPSLRRLAQASRRQPPETQPQPRISGVTPRWELDTRDTVEFSDRKAIAERIIEARSSLLSAPPGFADKVRVARLKLDTPDELMLRTASDAAENQAKIDAAVAPARNPESWTDEQRAIVASGGWCAPGMPRYELPSVVTAARPFRDSLPRVSAERGTINFVRAARLSTITANAANAAVTTWENTTDETPGGSTKTRQTHACRTIQEEELGAIVARMRFGNFQQRAFPEDIEHVLELLAAQHARVAEVRLLDALIGDMNIDVTQTGFVGTARDIAHHFRQAASEIRHTERMARGSVVRAAINAVALDMIQADVVMQQASGEVDALLVDEAFARRLVDSTGVTAAYPLDTPSGSDAFVTNSDGEDLADWPDNFEVPFWPDGSAVFADGGELNLGIIRDSTLNNTNDYEVFMETFEGLLWLGPYGKTLTLTTCPNGESQVATDETGALCSGS